MTRPRPVLTASAIAGGISTLAVVLGLVGLTTYGKVLSDQATAIASIVMGVIALGSHLLAALHAQGKVTPLASPVAYDGTPLGKVTEQVPTGLTGPVRHTDVVPSPSPLVTGVGPTAVHAEEHAADPVPPAPTEGAAQS